MLCRVMWLISCRTCRSRDYYSQTRPALLPRSGRSTCNPCQITPHGKHSKCLSNDSHTCHSRQVIDQMMTGPGRSRLAPVPVRKQLISRLSHQGSLSWHRMDRQMLRNNLHGRGRGLLLSEQLQDLRILMAVSVRQHCHDRGQAQYLQDSQMMPWYPSAPRMFLGRWGRFCPCHVASTPRVTQ